MNNIEMDNTDKDILGVSMISAAFAKMGWTLRERGRIDYGIDADVEIKTEGEYQNKHIALQIKSGTSYLKVKENGLITFSIDDWHYKYWLKSDRPVLILFYDTDKDIIIWEHVTLSKIQKTDTKYKVEFSPTKILTLDSKPELSDIVENHKPFEVFKIDEECNTFEYSIFAYSQINPILQDIVGTFARFRNNFNIQAETFNICALIHLTDTFTHQLSSNQDLVYENYCKSHWYLSTLAETISSELKDEFIGNINTNYDIVQRNISIWEDNYDGYAKLLHPNIPDKLQKAVKRLLFRIREYTATLNIIGNVQLEIKNKILNRYE